MTDVERLRRAIRDLHGVEGTHLRSEPVHETFQGGTVWEGVVEVFAVKGHPKAGAGLRLEPRDGRGRTTARCGPRHPPGQVGGGRRACRYRGPTQEMNRQGTENGYLRC